MGLLAVFQILLSRHTGMEDVVVGSPVANRPPEAVPLIGLLVNTLAVRTDLSGQPTFREVLARTRATILAAFEHQDAPFAAVVQPLQPKRVTSHSPIYQVHFHMKSYPDRLTPIGSLGFEDVARTRQTVLFDLELEAIPVQGGLRLDLKFNTALFRRATAAGLLDRFQVLLDAAGRQPDELVTRLPMLTDLDRLSVRALERGPEAATGEDQKAAVGLVPAWFEQQARRTPEATAVVFGDRRWTAMRARIAGRIRWRIGSRRLASDLTSRSASLLSGRSIWWPRSSGF